MLLFVILKSERQKTRGHLLQEQGSYTFLSNSNGLEMAEKKAKFESNVEATGNGRHASVLCCQGKKIFFGRKRHDLCKSEDPLMEEAVDVNDNDRYLGPISTF